MNICVSYFEYKCFFCCLLFDYAMHSADMCARQLAKPACHAKPKNVSIL